ncbi:MAG: hypothetical protein V2J89_13400, partial [Halieaceae bacterium]|nr:hypothetical protein [Halieaceae bacterium]
ERLYLDRGLRGQKTVGLLLHLLSASVLYLLARRLARGAGVEGSIPALAVAGLWLTLPLLLSTTLYVVQRMTLLAALFSLLSLLFYATGRDAQLQRRPALAWFVLCGLAFALSALSKENGLLTLPLLTVLELYIYRFRSSANGLSRSLAVFHCAAFLLPLLAFLLLILLRPEFLFYGYAVRDFSLAERLLSQALILFDYLRQVVWVDVARLGVYHDDIAPVRSAASLPVVLALLAWAGLALFALVSAVTGKLRMAGFAVAFFLVAHAMESTVFPLELYFEHRNYLPTAGLLLGGVFALYRAVGRLPALESWLHLLLAVLLLRNLVLLGSQAMLWSDSRLLHLQAVVQHPDSRRAALELGRVFAQDGNLEGALALLQQTQSLTRSPEVERQLLESVYYCMANRPLPAGSFQIAGVSREQLASVTLNNTVQHLTRLVLADKCAAGDGLRIADALQGWVLGGGEPIGTPRLYGSLLLVENKLERYEQALQYAKLLTRREPDNAMGLQFTLYLATRLQRADDAEQAMAALIRLRDAGRLTRQEAANLALFIDAPADGAAAKPQ